MNYFFPQQYDQQNRHNNQQVQKQIQSIALNLRSLNRDFIDNADQERINELEYKIEMMTKKIQEKKLRSVQIGNRQTNGYQYDAEHTKFSIPNMSISQQASEDNNIEIQLKKMRDQLEQLKKKYGQLHQQTQVLKQRVMRLECQMLTKSQFEKFQKTLEQKYSFFQGRIRVLEENQDKIKIYIDQKLKTRLKPSEQLIKKLEQLNQKNHRMFLYGNRIYWTLMNQVLAFRALSTGMVAKGSIPGKFKQIGRIIGTVSGLLGTVPVVGNILQTINKMASIFFNKQDEIVLENMSKRIQGYLTQDEISSDIANSVLLLLNNPCIQQRVLQYRNVNQPNPLVAFLGLIDRIGNCYNFVAEKFTQELLRVKKEKDDTDGITENVVADSSLIIWSLVQNSPQISRKPITCSVDLLIKSINQSQKQPQNLLQQHTKMPPYFRIKILSAEIKIDADTIGKMDPYCIIKYGDKSHKTQIQKKAGQNPIWNAQFILKTHKTSIPLYFQVYDHDTIGNDDFIGSAALTNLQISQTKQKISLYLKGELTGILFYQLSQ